MGFGINVADKRLVLNTKNWVRKMYYEFTEVEDFINFAMLTRQFQFNRFYLLG